MIEAAKLAFADREAWYGDPRQSEVPLAGLLSAAVRGSAPRACRRARRRASCGREPRTASRRGCRASRWRLPGRPAPPQAPAPVEPSRRGRRSGIGTRTRPRRHLPSRCRRPVRQHGVGHAERRLAAELAGHPRSRLLPRHQGADVHAHAGPGEHAGPGRRPRTTLSPSLALRDGEPYLAFGTPGGDQQDQWSLAFFLNHVLFGMNLQEAIDAPAFHTDHFPSSFYPRASVPRSLAIESRAGPNVIGGAAGRGHDVSVRPPWSLGRMSAVASIGRVALRGRQPARHAGLRGRPVGWRLS